MFSDLGAKRKFVLYGKSLNCKSAPEQALSAYSINTEFSYAEFTSESLAADAAADPICQEREHEESRRIRVEPCGFQSSRWHFMGTQPHATLVVILPPEHVQPFGCRPCHCNTHAPSGPHATEQLQFCPRRQQRAQRCRERSLLDRHAHLSPQWFCPACKWLQSPPHT